MPEPPKEKGIELILKTIQVRLSDVVEKDGDQAAWLATALVGI